MLALLLAIHSETIVAKFLSFSAKLDNVANDSRHTLVHQLNRLVAIKMKEHIDQEPCDGQHVGRYHLVIPASSSLCPMRHSERAGQASRQFSCVPTVGSVTSTIFTATVPAAPLAMRPLRKASQIAIAVPLRRNFDLLDSLCRIRDTFVLLSD